MKRLLLLCLISFPAFCQQNAVMLPWTPQQFTNTNGALLTSGKVCTYLAGTSTGTATFTDSTASVQNAIPPNAILLDSTARPTSGGIWLTPNKAYKIVTMTAGSDGTCSTGVVVKTQDNVTIGVASTTNNSFTGTNTFSNINNVIWLDGTTYAQTAAGLNLALAAGGSTKEVWVPSTAITLSDAIISIPKGAVLRFLGSQTFSIAGIIVADSTIDTTAREVIDCPSHAKLQLAANSNRDVITDTNFLTLSGSGNIFGTYKFTLRGCVIDGNKANQTALATRGTGNITNTARSAGGVSTINFSNTPSPAIQVGDRCRITGSTNSAFSFNTVAIAQSVTATQITYNQSGGATFAQAGDTGTVVCKSGANGVRIYGRSFNIEDNFIANNAMDGLWTDGFQNPSPVDDTGDTDSTVRKNRLMNSGTTGWIFAGSDGTQSTDNTEWGHGEWGREILRAGIRDAINTSYNNTLGSLHLFGGSIQESSGQETCQATNCEAILIDSNGGLSNFASMVVAAGGGVLTGTFGLDVRSPGHTFQGLIETGGVNTTGLRLGTAASAGGGIFTVSMVPIPGVSGAANMFDCTNETATPVIILHGQDVTDTLRGPNCWTGTEFLMIGGEGSVTGDRFNLQVPNGILRTTAPGTMPVLGGGFYGLGVDNGTSRWFMSPVNGGTPSIPIVGTTTTDTLTNKTINFCSTSQRTETAADTNLLTCAIPAQAGSYRVRFVLSVSAANAATLGWTATWTDSNGNAQSYTNLALFQAGNATPAATFTTSSPGGSYAGLLDVDVNNSGTPIVVKLTFSGTSFTAKASATVERII